MHLLRDSHGYFAFKTFEIVNSGYDLIDKELTEQQKQADDLGLLQGKSDRRIPDRKARGATVFISRGPLKGYKGKIVKADEVQAQVQIFAKGNQTVLVPRDAISSIFDSSMPLRMQQDAPMQISFDEAMNQEFVNQLFDEEGNPIGGPAADGQVELGTPLGSPGFQPNSTEANDGWN